LGKYGAEVTTVNKMAMAIVLLTPIPEFLHRFLGLGVWGSLLNMFEECEVIRLRSICRVVMHKPQGWTVNSMSLFTIHTADLHIVLQRT
jgi:hypothetical protein